MLTVGGAWCSLCDYKLFRRPEAGFNKVMSAIEAALESGYSCESDIKTLKINCVVMRGLNEDEIADFVTFTKDKPGSTKILQKDC
jgi:molybdenum cofactor biosynthesis enzyme MoaA